MTASSPKQRPILLRDPPAILANKRSTAHTPADLSTTAPKKRGRRWPPLHRVEQPTSTIPDKEPDDLQDINETLPTLFPVRRRLRNRQPVQPAQPLIVQPDVHHCHMLKIRQLSSKYIFVICKITPTSCVELFLLDRMSMILYLW